MVALRRILLILALASTLALLAAPAILSRRGAISPPQLVALAGADAGFARAAPGYAIRFPADEGPHHDFQSEWWYYTGIVATPSGRLFGYELTFFRRALAPPRQRLPRLSAWATEQVYMAHFALTDIEGRRFRASERFARGAAGLAGAEAAPFRVWLEGWSVTQTPEGVRRLRAEQGGIALDLALGDGGPAVLHGDGGYSQKGDDPGNASYYYSFTRLPSAGSVTIAGETFTVSGQTWMDHEWSTSVLAEGDAGWDWLAVRLDDGSDLMLYRIRRADGSASPFSSGTYVSPAGVVRRLGRDDIALTSDRTWRSPHSAAVYPARWTVKIAALGLSLDIEPYLADQELNLSYVYWEGAARASGEVGGRAVRGDGYVELTGYSAMGQRRF